MKIRLSLLALAGFLSVSTHSVRATTIAENFSSDPASSGWNVYGNSNLFAWNSANQNLEVTWDSSQSNSYFCHPTGTNLTKAVDFMLMFDLRLSDITIGVNPNKPLTYEIAVGFINLKDATGPGFIRGSGYESPNLVEMTYFPNDEYDFGASVGTPMISSDSTYAAGGFADHLELVTNALYRITMVYTADDQTLRTVMTSNNVPFGPVKNAIIGPTFGDFRVDHFGVNSYSDAGQYPGYEGSILAHGIVDNFVVAIPPPVTKITPVIESGTFLLHFRGTTNWLYHLERTTDFQSWSPASAVVAGITGTMTMQDTNPPAGNALYRVQARLP